MKPAVNEEIGKEPEKLGALILEAAAAAGAAGGLDDAVRDVAAVFRKAELLDLAKEIEKRSAATGGAGS